MDASTILYSIAILMLALTLWDDLSSGGRLTPRRKTFLIVAAAFAIINAVVSWL